MTNLVIHIDDGEKIPDICGLAIELNNSNSSNSKLLSSALIIIKPNMESKRHYHKVMEEIYFILEGKGEMRINDVIYNVNEGHSIFIPLKTKHQIKNTGKKELKFLSIDSPSYDEEDVYFD